ncbi:MAG TPA: hypothetical protein VGP02_18435 [Mycobacteriales bacterium]|nr:hypothetical protein [Mycobacteriales bacterium]
MRAGRAGWGVGAPVRAAEGVIGGAFARAGFREVEVRAVSAPLRPDSAAECLRSERESFGAPHQMPSGLSEDEREEAWAEIGDDPRRLEGAAGFESPCELLVAAAAR